VGFYNPSPRGEDEELRLDEARIDYWLSQGAKPSERVASLIKGAKAAAA
jgi:small subunit ribosomal protein S16